MPWLGGDILKADDHAAAALKLTRLVFALHDLSDKFSIPMAGNSHRLGFYDRAGKLVFAGKAGTGFSLKVGRERSTGSGRSSGGIRPLPRCRGIIGAV